MSPGAIDATPVRPLPTTRACGLPEPASPTSPYLLPKQKVTAASPTSADTESKFLLSETEEPLTRLQVLMSKKVQMAVILYAVMGGVQIGVARLGTECCSHPVGRSSCTATNACQGGRVGTDDLFSGAHFLSVAKRIYWKPAVFQNGWRRAGPQELRTPSCAHSVCLLNVCKHCKSENSGHCWKKKLIRVLGWGFCCQIIDVPVYVRNVLCSLIQSLHMENE